MDLRCIHSCFYSFTALAAARTDLSRISAKIISYNTASLLWYLLSREISVTLWTVEVEEHRQKQRLRVPLKLQHRNLPPKLHFRNGTASSSIFISSKDTIPYNYSHDFSDNAIIFTTHYPSCHHPSGGASSIFTGLTTSKTASPQVPQLVRLFNTTRPSSSSSSVPRSTNAQLSQYSMPRSCRSGRYRSCFRSVINPIVRP